MKMKNCFWELHDAVKCKRILEVLAEHNYNGEELTRKEIEKMFKGKHLVSVDWLTRTGCDDMGAICYRFNEESVFAKVSREEPFEIKKTSIRPVLIAENGDVITDVEPSEYRYNSTVRTLTEKMYGKCKIDYADVPIVAKRFYYTINVAALEKVARNADKLAEEYYSAKIAALETKLARYSTQLKKIQKTLDKLLKM